MLPASTVRAYDNSTRNKNRAAGLNFAWKSGAGAAGAAIGGLAAAKFLPKLKPFKNATTIMGRTFSRDTKLGIGGTMVSGGVGGAAGGIAGNESLKSIQRNKKKYGYRG